MASRDLSGSVATLVVALLWITGGNRKEKFLAIALNIVHSRLSPVDIIGANKNAIAPICGIDTYPLSV